jgi:hypothetical protein
VFRLQAAANMLWPPCKGRATSRAGKTVCMLLTSIGQDRTMVDQKGLVAPISEQDIPLCTLLLQVGNRQQEGRESERNLPEPGKSYCSSGWGCMVCPVMPRPICSARSQRDGTKCPHHLIPHCISKHCGAGKAEKHRNHTIISTSPPHPDSKSRQVKSSEVQRSRDL